MLFILDPDLIYKIDNNSNIQVVVSQIAYSRRKGHHIIYAEDKVFKFLASYEKLSSEARNIYLELYNNLSEAKSYLKYIKTKVHIVTNNIFNINLKKENNNYIIEISFDFFARTSADGKTILLTENRDDANVYLKITQIYCQWKKELSKIPLKYEIRGGGGQNIVDEFSAIHREKDRFCLCVTDSDKESPGDNYGEVSKKVNAIFNDSEKSLCQFLPLNVRNIENLFLINFYKQVFQSDVNKCDAIKFLQKLEDSEFSDARKYLHMKNKLKLYDILESSQKGNEQIHQYWLEVIKNCGFADFEYDLYLFAIAQLLNDLYFRVLNFYFHQLIQQRQNCDLDPKLKECLDNQVCKESIQKDCTCILFSGFLSKNNSGKMKIPNKIMDDCINKKSDSEIAKIVEEDKIIKLEWERIGETIIDWCCGSDSLI